MTITVRVKIINGEEMIDNQCIALLLGVEIEAVNALPIINGKTTIPREWIKRGRRRAKEVAAHTGSTAMLDGLRYWARKDYDAELNVVYQ